MPDTTSRLSLPELDLDQVSAFLTLNKTIEYLDKIIDLLVIDSGLNTPPISPAINDAYVVGNTPSGNWLGHANDIAYFQSDWMFISPFRGLRIFQKSNESLLVFDGTEWLAIGSTDFVTTVGQQTLSNKTLSGRLDIVTDGSRVGITNSSNPLLATEALLHIVNNGSSTCCLRATSYWTGNTASPFENNDNSLWETFNKVESNSINRSWAGSFGNAYNDIPEGVTDNGERTGIIGWAVSAARPGYVHSGTLKQMLGVHGSAGFQGPGSSATARIINATGVRGLIYNDSTGATITNAKAGEFISTASTGTVENNVAVYASASFGTVSNYAFYGNSGKIYNAGQVIVGNNSTQSKSFICARSPGNAYEFGHPDPNGYSCNFGASWSSGAPFISFCSEADPSGNTFTTRGKIGTIISNNLLGSLIFSRLPNPNSAGQSPVECARFDPSGHLILAETPYIPKKTPLSSTATGKIGEICWDENYYYVCVSNNLWKRAPLSSW